MEANYAASHWVHWCQQARKRIYRSEGTSTLRSWFVESIRVEILFLHSYDTVGLSQKQIWAKPVLPTDLSIPNISPVKLLAKGEKKKKKWHVPSWVSAVIFASPASTPLEHIGLCWRLGRPPRHRYGWGSGLDCGPCIREGLCKESLVIILGQKSSFVAFCRMKLFSFQKLKQKFSNNVVVSPCEIYRLRELPQAGAYWAVWFIGENHYFSFYIDLSFHRLIQHLLGKNFILQ